jgi:hypothetical protein
MHFMKKAKNIRVHGTFKFIKKYFLKLYYKFNKKTKKLYKKRIFPLATRQIH